MRQNETLHREHTPRQAPQAQSRFFSFFSFFSSSRVLSPNHPLKNVHLWHTGLSAHTRSLAAHISRHSRRQTPCRQKTIQDLLKVVVTGERYWGLADVVVLFWCVRDARPFISGDVIPSSCSAPMLLTLHLRFDVLASVSLYKRRSGQWPVSKANRKPCVVKKELWVSEAFGKCYFFFYFLTFLPAHLKRSLSTNLYKMSRPLVDWA